MQPKTQLFMLGALLLSCCSAIRAQEWADLSGTLILEGSAAAPKELPLPAKDKAAVGLSGDFKLFDEALVIDKETKGIANVLIFAVPEVDKVKMPIHPEYENGAGEFQIEISKLAYRPHASIMRFGQKLVLVNGDPIGHTVQIHPTKGGGFDFVLAPGAKFTRVFSTNERIPWVLSGSIEPYLKGFLLIRENPYFAITNEKGRFTIKNVPVGKWRFQFWQEKSGYLTSVKREGKKQAWLKGQVVLEISKGGGALGEILVSDANFTK